MTRSQYLKIWTTVILIFTLSWAIALRISAQVGPAPTLQNCNCIQVAGFKRTESSVSFGTATVYSDQVTFKFGSTVKSFFKHSNEVWVDDKENIWLLITTENGDKVFKNKKTIFYYNEKIK